VVGILCDRKNLVATLDIPLVIEPLELYTNKFSLLNNNYISLNTKFGVFDNEFQALEQIAVFPNEILNITRLNENKCFYYTIGNKSEYFLNGIHFRLLCDKIINFYQGENIAESESLYFVVVIQNVAVLFFFDHRDLRIFQIVNYESDIELLFHINRHFLEYSLNFLSQKIILLGEAENKMRAMNTLISYFGEVESDDLNPFSLFEN